MRIHNSHLYSLEERIWSSKFNPGLNYNLLDLCGVIESKTTKLRLLRFPRHKPLCIDLFSCRDKKPIKY